jgi:hypothetical protein
MMSFSSPEGRLSSDVGLIHITNEGNVGPEMWLTDTSDVDESAPHLARYGEGFLAGWTADGEHHIALVDLAGEITEGPVVIEAKVAAMDDMVTFPNGDVVWAYAWDDLSELKVMRVAWCDEG